MFTSIRFISANIEAIIQPIAYGVIDDQGGTN